MSKRPKGERRAAEVEEAQLKKRKATRKEAGKEISRLVAAEGDVGAGGPGPRASGCGLADPATEGAAEAPLDPDQGAGEHEQPQPNKPKATKPAPVLPWMRVPIAIEASEGILLEEVHGLDPRLKVTLEGGRAWAWLCCCLRCCRAAGCVYTLVIDDSEQRWCVPHKCTSGAAQCPECCVPCCVPDVHPVLGFLVACRSGN